VIEAVVKAASGDCGYAVVAAYDSGALEAWTGFADRSAAVLYKCAQVQEDANVVACEVLTDAEVRARAAKRHTLAQCAFMELARRSRPWLSVEIDGDRARVVASASALPASADALHDQLRTAKELFVREISPSTTDPVATLLKSCAALDTLHWFEGAASESEDAADQALQALDGNGRPGPDAATVRRAVEACPARLMRVVVGGYDVTRWYVNQPSPTSSTSSASTVTSLHHGPGHFRSVSEPFPPGWLDEPPTPPTPAAALHPLTQLEDLHN